MSNSSFYFIFFIIIFINIIGYEKLLLFIWYSLFINLKLSILENSYTHFLDCQGRTNKTICKNMEKKNYYLHQGTDNNTVFLTQNNKKNNNR